MSHLRILVRMIDERLLSVRLADLRAARVATDAERLIERHAASPRGACLRLP